MHHPLSTITSPFPPWVAGREASWASAGSSLRDCEEVLGPKGGGLSPSLFHVRPAAATAPPPPACVHQPLSALEAAPGEGRGQQVEKHGEQMEPPWTVGALKDHGAYPLYITDEIEVQRDEIHLFNPSSAHWSFLLPRKY